MGEKTKLKNVSDHETNQFWRMVAIGAIILIVFLSLPPLCSAHSHDSPDHHHHHDHDHDHDHGHHHHHEEPASFKWSKQANVVYEEEEGVHSHHDHHHDHNDHHDHDHHHDEHAHSHEQKPKNVPGKL